MKSFILIIMFVFSLASILVAQDVITVDPGTDQVSQAIFNTVYPGDIIELTGGDYTETQTLVIPFNLTIRGVDGETITWFVPGSVKEAIHVKGNVQLENIIFDTDSSSTCILNKYNPVNQNEEKSADKNNIFINHCQFKNFTDVTIHAPGSEDSTIVYPLDTLSVTNSLFYGGPLVDPDPTLTEHGDPWPGTDAAKSAITLRSRQVRVVIIQNCTFWRFFEWQAIEIEGYLATNYLSSDPAYLHILIDHITTFDIQRAGVLFENTNGAVIRNSIFGIGGGFGIKQEDCNDYTVEYNLADPKIGTNCGVCQPYHYNLTLGKNNLIMDPMFNDPQHGDFTLLEGSPAIGAAKDGSNLGNPMTDWSAFVTNVEEQSNPGVPENFNLMQNYPNPFNPVTNIEFAVPVASNVKLTIYSIFGHRIKTYNEDFGAGYYTITWDGMNNNGVKAATGVYFYQIDAESTGGLQNFVQVRKMLLMK